MARVQDHHIHVSRIYESKDGSILDRAANVSLDRVVVAKVFIQSFHRSHVIQHKETHSFRNIFIQNMEYIASSSLYDDDYNYILYI
jgi:hypothetical protein